MKSLGEKHECKDNRRRKTPCSLPYSRIYKVPILLSETCLHLRTDGVIQLQLKKKFKSLLLRRIAPGLLAMEEEAALLRILTVTPPLVLLPSADLPRQGERDPRRL